MTETEYNEKKQRQKELYISKVFSMSMGMEEDLLLEEAVEKFNCEYPPYENNITS